MKLVNMFLEEVHNIDGFSIVMNANSARLIPPKKNYYYRSNIIIKDLNRLERVLENYLLAISSTNLLSTKIDCKHDVRYFLGNLIKNLSNYDCNYFEEFVEIYTQFILDDTFACFDEKICLGSIDDCYTITVKRTEEYYGLETPFIFKIYKKSKHIEYELPLIRYGIYTNKSGNKVARIYAIQRNKNYDDSQIVRKMNKSFSPINSRVKEYRDVPPSMVASLTIFIGLLHSKGIYDIEAVDYISRRFTHFRNAKTEEDRECIQLRATNKFLKLFLRVSNHIDGCEVTYVPNEIDSFLHVKLNEQLLCKSPNVEPYLLVGTNYKDKNKVKSL